MNTSTNEVANGQLEFFSHERTVAKRESLNKLPKEYFSLNCIDLIPSKMIKSDQYKQGYMYNNLLVNPLQLNIEFCRGEMFYSRTDK